LAVGCVIDASLKYTTAMSMGGNFNTVFGHRIVDELNKLKKEKINGVKEKIKIQFNLIQEKKRKEKVKEAGKVRETWFWDGESLFKHF